MKLWVLKTLENLSPITHPDPLDYLISYLFDPPFWTKNRCFSETIRRGHFYESEKEAVVITHIFILKRHYGEELPKKVGRSQHIGQEESVPNLHVLCKICMPLQSIFKYSTFNGVNCFSIRHSTWPPCLITEQENGCPGILRYITGIYGQTIPLHFLSQTTN